MDSALHHAIKVNTSGSIRKFTGGLFRDVAYTLKYLGASYKFSHYDPDYLCSHKKLVTVEFQAPTVSKDAWIAPTAVLSGDVDLGEKSTVWYGTSIRGDFAKVKIGNFCSIGDRCVINTAPSIGQHFLSPKLPTVIGDKVIVDPGSSLYGCLLMGQNRVGAGSILSEGSVLEEKSIIGPGSLVPPKKVIPAGQLWSGNPLKFERNTTEDEIQELDKVAAEHVILAKKHEDTISHLPTKELNPTFQSIHAKGTLHSDAAAGHFLTTQEQPYHPLRFSN